MDSVRMTVVIPSYDPDEKLARTVDGLIALGFDDILLVDDGSAPERAGFFPSRPQCTLLRHEVNRGKGAALKTAFRAYLESGRQTAGVVTVDGDGQHTPEDVLRCAQTMAEEDKLVLGVRDFSGKDVPFRSRFGNNTTRFAFRLTAGLRLSDTQTGLRAIPARFLPDLLTVDGDRYEYETNVLLNLRQFGIPYTEVTIRTVYEDGNAASHFRPVRDSIRIYSLILKYAAASLASSGVDLALFFLLSLFLTSPAGAIAAAAIARVASAAVNFLLNRKAVFRSKAPAGRALVRYCILAAAVLAVSSGTIALLTRLFSLAAPAFAPLKTLLKFAVDTLLFFANYRIQKEWVFGR